MQLSTGIGRKRAITVTARTEPQYPCPRCGRNVTELRRLKRRGQEIHLDGECEEGHRLWRHAGSSVRWFEDWKRFYYEGCRCPVT